ncbi:hypothetical protein CDL15_Pgr003358 [Punica granatum]|nr:hypothetical protein CDL15_Pgr003358 [Punica granatum]
MACKFWAGFRQKTRVDFKPAQKPTFRKVQQGPRRRTEPPDSYAGGGGGRDSWRRGRESERKMEKALMVYGEVLRLVRKLPKDTRPYYAKYARENFVNYRDADAGDPRALQELFHRAYNHSIWVLSKV